MQAGEQMVDDAGCARADYAHVAEHATASQLLRTFALLELHVLHEEQRVLRTGDSCLTQLSKQLVKSVVQLINALLRGSESLGNACGRSKCGRGRGRAGNEERAAHAQGGYNWYITGYNGGAGAWFRT